MKTFLGILSAALLIAGISICGWILSRTDKTTPEIARLEKELKDARGEIMKLKEELAAERKAATTLSLEKSAKMARGRILVPSDEAPPTAAAPSADKGKGTMSAMRKMFDNPGMKEMMKQQSKVQIEMLFGKLFEHFQLTPEEKENFKDLLATRQAAQTDMGFKMMGDNLTPEQRKQITADYEAAKKANDELIKTFLGDDADYATFQHWEDTQPERMAFEMMGGRASFSTAGEPLSPDQEQQLIDTMAAVRKAPSKLPDLTKPENIQPGNITEEQISAQLQKFDTDALRVAQEAAKFLTPAQIEALKKFQTSARTMAEAGLKMSNAMFKGGK